MNQMILKPRRIITKMFPENGDFPNSGKLPLVIYDQVLKLPEKNAPDYIEAMVKTNGWGGCWRWGLYDYHHYHSTAHECLLIYSGSVRVQFGGPGGWKVDAYPGDVIILPAGLTHKNVRSSMGFRTVGCYPKGQIPDMMYGKAAERPQADQNITKVPLPKMDPIFGKRGELSRHWKG